MKHYLSLVQYTVGEDKDSEDARSRQVNSASVTRLAIEVLASCRSRVSAIMFLRCAPRKHKTRNDITIQLQGITIGHTELEHPDATKGVARGSFHPATGYQLVQDVFGLYAEAVPERPGKVTEPEKLQRYYRARDALGLELMDQEGRTVGDPTMHVYQRTVSRQKRLEIEVRTSDPVAGD